MRNLSLFATVTGGLVALLVSTGANAQATRTWVSGVGDDANPCSRTAPCKTFAGAISKTAVNGEINCLDPAGYGAVTATKSITFNCFYTDGSILNAGTSGIIVNITSATDALKTVRVVGININGSSGGTRSGITGINILAATNVFIENVLISDQTQNGINDSRTGPAGLFVNDTIVRNNAGTGLRMVGSALNAQASGLKSLGNANGIAMIAGTELMLSRCVLSTNTGAGLDAGNGTVSVDGCDIAHNGAGVSATAGSTVRISNNNIAFNATGISGATTSFGNNRIAGNPAPGTAPTPAGADSHDKAQQ